MQTLVYNQLRTQKLYTFAAQWHKIIVNHLNLKHQTQDLHSRRWICDQKYFDKLSFDFFEYYYCKITM